MVTFCYILVLHEPSAVALLLYSLVDHVHSLYLSQIARTLPPPPPPPRPHPACMNMLCTASRCDGRSASSSCGTVPNFSWPDEPGLWTGMDGTEYDVEISIDRDGARVALTLLVFASLVFFIHFISVSNRFIFISPFFLFTFPAF